MIPLPRLLDNNGNEVRRIRPARLSISENIVPLSTASMTLLKGDVIPYRSYIELFTVSGSRGVYRAKMPSIDYGDSFSYVELEHAICEIGDYLIHGTIEQAYKPINQAITEVFSYYSGTRWQLGTVSVNADVVLSADYSNILTTINSLISQADGAMMTFDFSTTPWTFNVVNREQNYSAEGRLSRNIESVEIGKNDRDLCTRVWLKNLSSVASQSYMDSDTIGTYGVIEKVLTDRKYTTIQAQQVASQYLAKHKHPIYSVKIDGVDLSNITGESLDKFSIGKKFRLTIPEDFVTIEEPIVSIVWADVYGNPNAVRLVLSQPEVTETSLISNLTSEVYGTDAYGNGSSTYMRQSDYKIELVAEEVGTVEDAVETLDDRVDDAETELSNKYTIRSGIEIEPEGVTISGSKFLKIESGGSLDVVSTNFKLNSNDRELITGDWKFNGNGAIYNFGTYNDEQLIFQIAGVQDTVLSNTTTGIYTERSAYSGHGQLHFSFAASMLSSDYNRTLATKTRSAITFIYDHNESQWELRRTGSFSGYAETHSLGSSQLQWDKAFVREINGGIDNEIKIKRGSDLQSILQWISYRRETMPGTSTLVDCFGADCADGNLGVAMLGCQDKEWSHIYGKTIFYTTLVQNSSRDIKHAIKALPSVGEKLDQLRPVTFVYDKDADETQRMGLIYEDTVEVMPEICTNNEANKAINYVELIPALLKEIQELRARVAELERRG